MISRRGCHRCLGGLATSLAARPETGRLSLRAALSMSIPISVGPGTQTTFEAMAHFLKKRTWHCSRREHRASLPAEGELKKGLGFACGGGIVRRPRQASVASFKVANPLVGPRC